MFDSFIITGRYFVKSIQAILETVRKRNGDYSKTQQTWLLVSNPFSTSSERNGTLKDRVIREKGFYCVIDPFLEVWEGP